MSFFTQTRASKLLGLTLVMALAALIGPVSDFVRASDSNHILDVNISCDAQPHKDQSGFITDWRFSVTGSQVNGPTTQVKIHIPWAPYAVEGPGSGTTSTYTYVGAVPPSTWTASAETFQLPGWAGSLTQCNFDFPPDQPNNTPELSVLKTGPATANANTDVTYTVLVKNTGNGDATGVSVSDVFDQQKLTFVSASLASCQLASNGAPIVACTIGGLAAHQSQTVTFTFHIKPTAACSQINNKAEMGAVQQVSQPWSMVTTNVSCPTPTLVCAPTTQTVNVNQTANLTATGGTGTYAWSAAGASTTSGSNSSFATSYATAGTKTVTVTSGTQTANCSVVVQTPPSPKYCKLEISKSANKTTAKNDDTVVYTLSFKNTGDADCTGGGVKVQDVLSSGLTFVSETHSANVNGGYGIVPVYQPNTRTLTWNANVLNPGEAGTATVTVKVNDFTPVCSTRLIANRAQITAEEYDHLQTWVYSNVVNITASSSCPPPTLVCAPSTQTVDINQNANLTATGGTGTYAWSAAGANTTSGSGSSFTTKYATSGTKTVTVTSGTQSANCSVVVRPPVQVPTLVCAPTTQTVNVNQTANLTATGGTGTYAWSAAGASTTSGSNSSFATSYATAGTKTVTVTSGTQTANCSVVVNPITTTTLVCTPADQSVYTGYNANFSATGGTGTYAWSTNSDDATPRTGSGNAFAASFGHVGTKIVTVTSGTQSANCSVDVSQPIGGCVGASCSGNPGTLAITKEVRNVTRSGLFAHSATMLSGDTLEYRVTITNRGSYPVTQVTATDALSSGAGYLDGPFNYTVNRNYSGTLASGMQLGTLNAGESVVIGYQYRVRAGYTSGQACNIATADGQNNSAGRVQDTACVGGTVQGTNVILQLYKKARNDTKNADATQVPASREDYITYTLTVTNVGNSDATNYVITDSLSGVLPLADIIDLGGGSLNGQTLSYPAVTIPANGTVSRTFRVRVKYFLSPSISYQMLNTFGNTVTVLINPPTPYVPPKTGGMTDVLGGLGFAGLLTSVFVLQRKKNLFQLIFS